MRRDSKPKAGRLLLHSVNREEFSVATKPPPCCTKCSILAISSRDKLSWFASTSTSYFDRSVKCGS